jgi:D-glycero-alpha-D-manno-heptose-7-phosphate kinase
MIISQTPLRISFIGGGTDLAEFYKHTAGSVISTTIDKYIYIIIKDRFDDKIYLNYSEKEIVADVNDVKHDLIREVMLKTGVVSGIEITTLADIPSEGSGLGSSSSVLVGLLNALYTYKGIQAPAEKLAREACEIEINILKKPIGKQDQYIAAYGGIKEIVFNPDESVIVNEVTVENKARRSFGSNILLFYTDITRKSATILITQKQNTKENFETLVQMRDSVYRFKEKLESNDNYDDLGKMLDETWIMKKKLAKKITNQSIEDMYNLALTNGAIGGKIAGAGGGGFLMLYVPRERQQRVRKALREYREFPFMLEPFGSRIIFNSIRGYWK